MSEVFTIAEEINFPPVTDTSEAAWTESIRRMEAAETALPAVILQTPESRLEEPVVEGGMSVYILFHGAIQHSLYHAGQMMLLRRAIDKYTCGNQT